MKHLFNKNYYLYNIYFDLNLILITEQYNGHIYQGINYNYVHFEYPSMLQYIFGLICVFKIN